MDRTQTHVLATTDPNNKIIFLSDDLYGEELVTVLLHELGHATMVSFNLLEDIYRMVKPEYHVEAEEWICNFIADYGRRIFEVAYEMLGVDAWRVVPYELERFAL